MIDESIVAALTASERETIKSKIEAQFIDTQLAEVVRYVCRYGFHEAAHLIALARQSIKDQAEMIPYPPRFNSVMPNGDSLPLAS